MEALINYFKKLGFEESNLTEFLNCITIREFDANENILVEGQIENYLSFIGQGIVRYYAISDGKEITFDFAFENSFYCAYDSFYNRKKTAVYIQAITNCQLYSITSEDLLSLYSKCETSRKLGQLATEFLLSKKVKREMDLLLKTPQQRYEALFTEQTKLIKSIPQKYIASYIGVVPETLSRIRKRIS
jgi:CRP-like cAMP-binding protein